jgi:hypothetical protein
MAALFADSLVHSFFAYCSTEGLLGDSYLEAHSPPLVLLVRLPGPAADDDVGSEVLYLYFAFQSAVLRYDDLWVRA